MTIAGIIGLLAAAGTTVSFLPQAVKTISTKNTSGISVYMYALFAGANLLWLIYGVLIRDLPVIAANTVTMILASVILIYKIVYK